MAKFKPELLLPAGSFEKLVVAINYGADAVYLAGQKYGLRQAADNLSNQELREAKKICVKNNVKMYVVINSFFHDKDFLNLKPFLLFLEEIKVDAIIVSDLGVISFCHQHVNIPIHLSTQASCVSIESANFWKEMNVERIVLGREASISEAGRIKKEVGIEVEMFIHGSMCMSYSGQCTISNYTQGRDSNRGGCGHSCRFEYSNKNNSEIKIDDFFMSSKDLSGVNFISDFFKYEIDSVKVEGRMKTPHYVASIGKVYSQAINTFFKDSKIDSQFSAKLNIELDKISHREYFDGSLAGLSRIRSASNLRQAIEPETQVIGQVIDYDADQNVLFLRSNYKFFKGDLLEVLTYLKFNIRFYATNLKDVLDQDIEYTRPSQIVKIYLNNSSLNNKSSLKNKSNAEFEKKDIFKEGTILRKLSNDQIGGIEWTNL